MALSDLIKQIEGATAPGRDIDVEIALLLGWRRKVEYVKQDEHGEPVRKVFWVVPTGGDYGKVPRYTSSVDAAMTVVQEVAPGIVGGVSWEEDGRGAAILGDGTYCQAATPAMALCIAALKAKQTRDDS